ncbi:TadE family protein [Limnoglobus roseus]|uniref:Pilus assembly protein n=1 Tax=Limnoglobus roseus TaxID=2598579 RepID=A0A5C1AAB0_9BACT|nr:TadE family protein [Limnoglobus roseus]QEL13988.1 pilus assembly protein [Limnoglobus roseus]
MMIRRSSPSRRCGVATVEAAVVLSLLLVPVLLGVWEVGRLIYVQQVVTNAAREGARLAAQGRIVNRLGTPTAIAFSTGTPNVKDTVYQALITGGLSNLAQTDVTVKFAFDNDTLTASPSYNPSDGTKNQRFRVYVEIPFSKVRWITVGLVNPTIVSYTVDWQMLVDDAFTVNSDLPQW